MAEDNEEADSGVQRRPNTAVINQAGKSRNYAVPKDFSFAKPNFPDKTTNLATELQKEGRPPR